MPSVIKRATKSLKKPVAKLKAKVKAITARNGVKVKPSNGVQAKGAAKASGKRIYFFGGGKAEGNKEMKNLLGGKGANVA